MRLRALCTFASAAVVAVAIGRVRARWLRWGATDREVDLVLPGDDLVARADLTATRAVTVRADTDGVWPWIAQLGQGRGGFYSYDRLENLVGCDIHSADRIMPEWQSIAVGDDVNLAPAVGLTAAVVDPGRALVLRGGMPMSRTAAPYDFTWAFVTLPQPDGTTRLVVRERYGFNHPWARLLVEPVEALSFVMSRRMLHGIRERAERSASASPAGDRGGRGVVSQGRAGGPRP